MKVSIKRKIEHIDENGTAEISKIEAQRDTELAGLERQRANLQSQINNINQRIATIKQRAANQISQLANKINNSDNTDSGTSNQNDETVSNANVSETFLVTTIDSNRLFEGKNIKHDLLADAILNALSNNDFSYTLSDTEIKRWARKFNDIFKENNNTDWKSIRIKIKEYILKQAKISMSHIEINNFLDNLEYELNTSEEYNIFSSMFDNDNNIIINFDDDTNVDELENELTDAGFEIVDEDFENNTITILNVKDKKLLYQLNNILNDYYLDEINDEIIF